MALYKKYKQHRFANFTLCKMLQKISFEYKIFLGFRKRATFSTSAGPLNKIPQSYSTITVVDLIRANLRKPCYLSNKGHMLQVLAFYTPIRSFIKPIDLLTLVRAMSLLLSSGIHRVGHHVWARNAR